MTWKMNDMEFESVFSLPAPGRYSHFIKRVADWGKLWTLSDCEGFALASDAEGIQAIPVWPHERYATASAVDHWAKYLPEAIPLEEWMVDWIPGLIKDSQMVAVFPNREGKSAIVTPDRLRIDLLSELDLII